MRDWVLENGSWNIQNKPLVLRKWEPSLKKLDFDFKHIPVWIQLYDVPLELFSRGGLSYITSAVGIPLYMDYVTASNEILEFSKVCVEVEAGTLLPDVINVVLHDGSVVMICVYAPWFHKFCTQCKIFGNQTHSCVEITKAKGKTKDNLIWRRKDNSNPGFLEKSDKIVNVVANSVAQCGEVPKLLSSELKDTVQVIVEDNIGFSQEPVKVISDVTDKNLQHSVDQVGEGLPGVAADRSLPSVDQENTRCGGAVNGNKMAKKKRLPLSVLKICDQAISIVGDVVGHKMVITDVYGSNNSLVRRGLWAHLKSLEFDVGSFSWVVGGDFDAQENSDMDDFKECLVDLELQDHPYIGPLFTWSNKQENSFLARKLDRILINPQWLFEFPDSAVEFKAQGVSDHYPGVIWTQKRAQVHKPKPFKFFNCWTANENFLRVVKDSWLEQCGGNTMQLLFNKLKRLNPLLKELNRSHFSDISSRVVVKRAELESI
ncbi:uncharacterized protein LOC120218899 [Hibiscus syriacus]|uniref:uncharacterized protein LOC120218899 n=1 Tax=Hibiscus syriacus TaxID=106335 RepID=UPI001921104F|nr:uncharacterized protein LOC120218899 [Hibiscus syriacus]